MRTLIGWYSILVGLGRGVHVGVITGRSANGADSADLDAAEKGNAAAVCT